MDRQLQKEIEQGSIEYWINYNYNNRIKNNGEAWLDSEEENENNKVYSDCLTPKEEKKNWFKIWGEKWEQKHSNMVKTIQEAKIWAEGVVDCLNFNDDCSLENLWTIIKKYLPKDWCLDVFLSLEIEWNDYGYEIVNGEPKKIEEEEVNEDEKKIIEEAEKNRPKKHKIIWEVIDGNIYGSYRYRYCSDLID